MADARAKLKAFGCYKITCGHTGSGKTHSLFGDMSCKGLEGIVPRSVHELFNALFQPGEDRLDNTGCQVPWCFACTSVRAIA